MVFDEVLPLYFTAPIYAGGLGITPSEFAKTLSLLGAMQLVFQFVIYPKLTKRFSTLVLCKFGFVLYIPIYISFPELTTLQQLVKSSDHWLFRLVYMVLLIIRFGGNCLTYTGLGIMVSTSSSPEILGTVNG
jgi:hypothetical protein